MLTEPENRYWLGIAGLFCLAINAISKGYKA